MKSVLITNERKIDFSKPQLLISEYRTVVLSIGKHSDYHFSGVVLNGSSHGLGYYSESWLKENFRLFEGEIKLSND